MCILSDKPYAVRALALARRPVMSGRSQVALAATNGSFVNDLFASSQYVGEPRQPRTDRARWWLNIAVACSSGRLVILLRRPACPT